MNIASTKTDILPPNTMLNAVPKLKFIFYLLPLYFALIVFNIWYISIENAYLYIILYVIAVFFVTMCVTVVVLQKVLKENMLMNWNLWAPLKGTNNESKVKHLNLENLAQLSRSIDKVFIKKWYYNISDNEQFCDESRVVLEEILQMFLTCNMRMNHKNIAYGVGNIFLKHIKEYRRSLRRKSKYGGTVKDMYRYSHSCMTSKKSQKHFINQLTKNVLHNFTNWELWNSLPCQVVVSILSNKAANTILKQAASPKILNYLILKSCASPKLKEDLNFEKYSSINLISVENDEDADTEDLDKDDFMDDKIIEKNDSEIDFFTQKNVEKISNEETDNLSVTDVENVENSSENLAQSDLETFLDKKKILKVQKDSGVKIYRAKSAKKTWNNSSDLKRISLGEDPLLNMSLNLPEKEQIIIRSESNSPKSQNKAQKSPSKAGNSFKKPEPIDMNAVDPSIKKEYPSPPLSAKSLFDEVKNITSMEGLKSSIKPLGSATVSSLYNMNFQDKTVTQVTSSALNKIGEMQGEAAVVVEGLLDFGRAGLRKGLKLTGLQDNQDILNIENKNITKARIEKTPAVVENEFTIIGKEETIFDASWKELTDLNNLNENNEKIPRIPSIMTDEPHSRASPDLEYEETADLATSIAKLRSLLQQKSSESSISTPLISPLPPYELASKLDSSDIDEIDGDIPSVYRFWAKTATDVFTNTLNSIKTALPANPSDDIVDHSSGWIYEELNTEESSNIKSRMEKLLSERKEFCKVEPAYEALDSLDSHHVEPMSFIQFQDELDDFELKIPLARVLVDIFCELVSENNTVMIQEPLIRSILIFLGTSIEQAATQKIENISEQIENATSFGSSEVKETLDVDFDTFVNYVLDSLPETLTYTLGKEVVRNAVRLLVLSLQVTSLNQDIMLQIFELICLKLIEESSKMTPPPSGGQHKHVSEPDAGEDTIF